MKLIFYVHLWPELRRTICYLITKMVFGGSKAMCVCTARGVYGGTTLHAKQGQAATSKERHSRPASGLHSTLAFFLGMKVECLKHKGLTFGCVVPYCSLHRACSV